MNIRWQSYEATLSGQACRITRASLRELSGRGGLSCQTDLLAGSRDNERPTSLNGLYAES